MLWSRATAPTDPILSGLFKARTTGPPSGGGTPCPSSEGFMVFGETEGALL